MTTRRAADGLRSRAALAVALCATAVAFAATRAYAAGARRVPPVVDAGPASCAGRWEGIGDQPGFARWTIDMRVTATEGASCGTIEYPSLGCGGALERCAVQPDGRVRFVERYTHNPGTCAPAGVIVARCDGDAMHWYWTGQGSAVASVLRRR